jgi:serine phosphatase RsbU (regulator of sigma subunit)/putative methionine-R-sulfoxide reductase with GAF domain
MSKRDPKTAAPDWRELASLGEQLLNATSLAAQRDRIQAMVTRLVDGEATVWLDETLFRLPDWDAEPIFTPEPSSEWMRRAFESGQMVSRQAEAPGDACVAAIPIEEQGYILGVLQISRPGVSSFSQEDLDGLAGLSSIAAVALVASHRVAVERWRIGQLSLVRSVSAQIANLLDVDELSRRVTALIRETFKYYYVAIFTLSPGQTALRYRASARASRKGRRKASMALEVELGQGLIGHVAQTGQEMLTDDVQNEPRFRFIGSLPETRSEVVLPLKVEDRVLGVLDVQSDQESAFHPNDLLVLRALADNIALAIEGARLYGDLRRRADQLAVIAEVSDSITTTLDLKALMKDMALLVQEKFGYPFVHLFTVHHNRRQIIYEAGSGERSEVLSGGYAVSLDDESGIIPWVARNNQTVLLNDVTLDERYRPSPLPPVETHSELTVPLTFNGKVAGILDIQSDKKDAFTEDDRLIFEALADNIAAAIHNADLYSSEQWRRQVADSLREVAGLLSANVGVEQVLESVLTELERNLPCDITAIWLLDGEELFLAAAHGIDPHEVMLTRMPSNSDSEWMTEALLADQPIIRKPEDPYGPLGLAGKFENDYSAIVAPLRIGDQPLGVLSLAHHTPGRYGHEAQAMTTTFASYAAVAIENARLYDVAQEQAYASAALLQVAQAVVSMNDLGEILATIVRIMPILVGVEVCAIYLWDEDLQMFYPGDQYGVPEDVKELVWAEDYAIGEFPLLDIVREQNRIVVNQLEPGDGPHSWLLIEPDDNLFNHIEAFSSGERLMMAFPLSIKTDIFGVMLIEEASGGRRFRERRLEILTGIAQQVALAAQNDRLQLEMVVRERLEYEVQLARQIQQTFIPEILPQIEGWNLAARWRTARQVGGDFYDVLELPNGKIGLFIADVADKGVPAALFMALTRTLVRAAVLETDSPAEALRRVNTLLYPDCEQGMFVTAFYAVLETKTGKVTYANAGHNPPIWQCCNSNSLTRLVRTGMALGAIESLEISEQAITLEDDDCLLMYTDGLTESFSPEEEMFGEARLASLLHTTPARTASAILDHIDNALVEFIHPLPLSDDLTMLVLTRNGQ